MRTLGRKAMTGLRQIGRQTARTVGGMDLAIRSNAARKAKNSGIFNRLASNDIIGGLGRQMRQGVVNARRRGRGVDHVRRSLQRTDMQVPTGMRETIMNQAFDAGYDPLRGASVANIAQNMAGGRISPRGMDTIGNVAAGGATALTDARIGGMVVGGAGAGGVAGARGARGAANRVAGRR